MKSIKFQFILFLLFFGIFMAFINESDSLVYRITHPGIESIVERGTYYFEGSKTPGYQPIHQWWSDDFEYKGHSYFNKQPGVYFIGAIPYFFLHKLGITYVAKKGLTAALVSLFTTAITSAILLVLLFNIVFEITENRKNSVLITSFAGLGTILFPYSGLIHHDTLATFFLFCGFYTAFYKFRINKKSSEKLLLLSGFLTGFSFFCSYNVFAVILAITFYVALNKKLKSFILYFIALLVSLSISLIFNYFTFGDFLSFSVEFTRSIPSLKDSYPSGISLEKIKKGIDIYFFSPITSITFISPIVILSIFGGVFIPNKFIREKIFIYLVLFFTVIQLSSIKAVGWCQYGPRYMLEAIPFLMLGLSGYFCKYKNNTLKTCMDYVQIPVILVGVISIEIAMLGSLISTMYCGYYQNAFLNYLNIITTKGISKLYFFNEGCLVICLSIALFFLTKVKNNK